MRLRNRLKTPWLALGLGTATLVGCTDYSRNIGDVKVNYLTHPFANKMTIVKDDTTFVLMDNEGRDFFDYDNDEPLNDQQIDWAKVTIGDNGTTYSTSKVNDNTLSGRVNKTAFERFNPWYNELRHALRDSLRKDYLDKNSGVQVQ